MNYSQGSSVYTGGWTRVFRSSLAWITIIGLLVFIATFLSATRPANAADLTSGLIGWWKFDEGSGTAAADSSGSGYNATLTNFPGDGSGWQSGVLGSSLRFNDGLNTYVSTNNILLATSSSRSYSLWINRIASSSSEMLIAQKMSGSNDCAALWLENGRYLNYMRQSALPFQSATYTYNVPESWVFLTVTWDDTTAKLYINGSNVSSAAKNTCNNTIQNGFFIGHSVWTSSAARFNGYMDDVRVYNRTISDAEVFYLYKEGIVGYGYSGGVNLEPIAYPGSAQTVTLPATVTLQGDVHDDGLPVGASVTATWSKVSGPGTVTFTDDNATTTVASFSAAGTYVIQLEASDGELASSSPVTITVNAADVTAPSITSSYPSGTLSAGTTDLSMWVITNETASCKYDTTSGTAYASQNSTFSTTTGRTHRVDLSGLTNGSTYTYYARCQDEVGNATSTDHTISFSIASPSASAQSFYVSTTGTAGGDGSLENPWDLATALAHPGAVQAGDTIWLRGGTYTDEYTSTLAGTTAGQITVRSYTDEWAVINGGITQTSGGYVTFRDFEITNSTEGVDRVSAESSTSPDDITTSNSLTIGSASSVSGMKAINLVIHNVVGSGAGLWSNAPNLESYGNIVYNNGWDAPDRGHGHGFYVQNNTGSKNISENILFGNLGGYGIHQYTEGGTINNFDYEGNVVFDNTFLSGGSQPVNNLFMAENYIGENGTLLLGYSVTATNTDAYLYNNRIYGGTTGLVWRNLKMTLNKFIGSVSLRLPWGDSVGDYDTDGNQYYSGSHTILTRTGSTVASSLSNWQSLGLDSGSTYSASNPTTNEVFVRPNKYESGRANIIVYNWEGDTSVNVDLSSILNVGDVYELRDAQNYLSDGDAISGVYGGDPISVPMTLTEVASYTGDFTGAYHTVEAEHTSSAFQVFVVRRTDAAAAPTMTTSAASDLSTTAGTINGSVGTNVEGTASEHGFAWGTSATLSGGDTATTTLGAKSGTGSFSSSLSSLTCNTTYYARAYATNLAGTGYGDIVSFTTSACPVAQTSSSSGGSSAQNRYDNLIAMGNTEAAAELAKQYPHAIREQVQPTTMNTIRPQDQTIMPLETEGEVRGAPEQLERSDDPGFIETVTTEVTNTISRFKNFVLASLSREDKSDIPPAVVFAKPKDLPTYTSVEMTEVHIPQGKSLDLAVKIDEPAKTVTGYLTIQKIDLSQALEDLSRSQLAGAASSIESKMVLATFSYADPDEDGIYTATIDAPKVHGTYDILTVIEYEDKELGHRELHLTTVVDPEGYVYTMKDGLEARLPDAIVTLLVKDSTTSAFTTWPATEFEQVNPQTTGKTGAYSFLVPPGRYQLIVSVPGYYDYTGEEFITSVGAGVHENIELTPRSWWRSFFRFFGRLF